MQSSSAADVIRRNQTKITRYEHKWNRKDKDNTTTIVIMGLKGLGEGDVQKCSDIVENERRI